MTDSTSSTAPVVSLERRAWLKGLTPSDLVCLTSVVTLEPRFYPVMSVHPAKIEPGANIGFPEYKYEGTAGPYVMLANGMLFDSTGTAVPIIGGYVMDQEYALPTICPITPEMVAGGKRKEYLGYLEKFNMGRLSDAALAAIVAIVRQETGL